MPLILELRNGSATLRLAPHLGGRVTALRLDAGTGARPVLFPFPEDATNLLRWPKGGLYPLLPYGNRIRDSRLIAHRVTLRPHPDAAPHTLHGPAHRDAWTVEERGPAGATLRLDRAADEEWPWRIEGRLRFDLVTPDRARIDVALTNRDDRPMPGGLGLHPYFAHAPDAAVSVDASLDWPAAPDGMTERSRPAPAMQGPLPPGEVTLHRSGWRGAATAALPTGGRIGLARLSGPLDHLVVHRPAAGRYLCLEPTSHVADAFNLASHGVPGTGAVTLGPGERMMAEVEIALLA